MNSFLMVFLKKVIIKQYVWKHGRFTSFYHLFVLPCVFLIINLDWCILSLFGWCTFHIYGRDVAFLRTSQIRLLEQSSNLHSTAAILMIYIFAHAFLSIALRPIRLLIAYLLTVPSVFHALTIEQVKKSTTSYEIYHSYNNTLLI